MTSTDLILPDNLLDVRTGELVPATAENAAHLLYAAREMRAKMLSLVKDCEAVLIAQSRVEGSKTLHINDVTAEITGGTALEWDLGVLTDLLEAGLPQDRYDQLVVASVTYKVDARVAKQLESANPAYAEIIARARNTVEKPWRVSIK
jgi:hypothetical protein